MIPQFVSPARFYQTKEGEIVGADHPERAILLVAKGVSMAHDKAQKLGIIEAASRLNEAPVESLELETLELDSKPKK